ncbi:thioredoxin [bacterium]|nr:thioredoxin [bacterium]
MQDIENALAEQGPVIVKVYASWCGPCKRMEQIFNQAALYFSQRVSFYALSVDNNTLVQDAINLGLLKRRPRTIPSFVTLNNGFVVNDVHVGSMNEEAMILYINQVFGF